MILNPILTQGYGLGTETSLGLAVLTRGWWIDQLPAIPELGKEIVDFKMSLLRDELLKLGIVMEQDFEVSATITELFLKLGIDQDKDFKLGMDQERDFELGICKDMDFTLEE